MNGAGSATLARADPVQATLLFRVACLFDGAANRSLAVFQSLFDRRLTGQGSRNILTQHRAEGLKFRDEHELNPGVRHRLNGWIRWVCALHGLERSGSEGGLLVFRVVVGRLSRAGRNSGPANVLRNQLDVVLRSGPYREFLCRLGLFGGLGDGKRPGPEPVRPIRRVSISRSEGLAASSIGCQSNSACMAFVSSLSSNGKEIAVLLSHRTPCQAPWPCRAMILNLMTGA